MAKPKPGPKPAPAARETPSYRTLTRRMAPRETLHSAWRYSIFVKFMKRILPICAIALGLAVLIYAMQPRDTGKMALTFEKLGRIQGDLTMVNPKLTGTDNDGMPFVITAANAVQVGVGSDKVRLEKVSADLSLKDGSALRVTANEGLVDSGAHQLLLTGGISISTAEGYKAVTEVATADLRSGLVQGDKPIEADGAFGHVSADRFVMNKETKQLRFMGNVRMLLHGDTR